MPDTMVCTKTDFCCLCSTFLQLVTRRTVIAGTFRRYFTFYICLHIFLEFLEQNKRAYSIGVMKESYFYVLSLECFTPKLRNAITL